MYISITKQHQGTTFSQSSSDFVNYLEKENQDKAIEFQEHFFDQNNDWVSPKQVIREIDGNTAKLKKRDPKFYSLTLNPSQRELKHIGNDPKLLRQYVREAMKDYAAAFYRDPPVLVDSIKYFAKIEYQRTYKGYDKVIMENQPFKAKIAKLEHDLIKIEQGKLTGNSKTIKRQLTTLKAQAPHLLDGKMVTQGMKKPGLQTHIHIIVSRKDSSNTLSLSPGSSHKASETILNGKTVKRGFHRDAFYENAEKTFDRMFYYNRNFIESYTARKMYLKNTRLYFAHLVKLPVNERSVAFKLLSKTGVHIPVLNIPTNQVQLAIKIIKQFRKVMDNARSAGSIGV